MTIIYIILVIIAIPLIIAFFIKKNYSLQREIVISKPREEVFNYIKYLKNQDNYSVWALIDPAMKKTYTGVDGTPGFTAAWDSENKKAGKGKQEIKRIAEGERVDTQIRFIKPFEGLADAYMQTVSEVSGQTKVIWGFSSSMKYPMNIMLLVMNIEKMVGNDLAGGLANLKIQLEK